MNRIANRTTLKFNFDNIQIEKLHQKENKILQRKCTSIRYFRLVLVIILKMLPFGKRMVFNRSLVTITKLWQRRTDSSKKSGKNKINICAFLMKINSNNKNILKKSTEKKNKNYLQDIWILVHFSIRNTRRANVIN